MHCLTRVIHTCLVLFELLSLKLELAGAGSVRVVLVPKSCHLLILSEHQVVHCGIELVDMGLLANAEAIDTLDITNLFLIALYEMKDFVYMAYGGYARVHGL